MTTLKFRKKNSWLLMLAIAPAAALLPGRDALAASGTWLAAPTNGNWITTTETNWSTGTATFVGSASGNSNPDIATFSQTSSVTTINITNSLTLGGIIFDTAAASAYTINRTAGTFRVSDGGEITSTSTVVNPEIITAAMTLNATSSTATTNSYTFNNDSTTTTATLTFSGNITTGSGAANLATTFTLSGANTGNNLISGVISDQGTAKPLALIKSGTGTWILAGNNNYNGPTTINSGILQIGNVGATSTSGSLGTGAVTDNASLVFNRSNTLTVASNISGNGTVTQTGSGTLTLSGNNSYSGGTTISLGAISIGSATALSAGPLTFDPSKGGFLDLNRFDTTVSSLSGNPLAIISDNNANFGTTTLILSGTASSAYSGTIADGVNRFLALNVTGGANLTLTGINNYSGGTTIDNGTITIDDNGSLGSEGGVLTIHNGTLHVPTVAGNITEARTFQLASATSTIQVDSGIVFDITGSVMDFTSPGTLNKTGAGTLLLDSPDFYTGGTTIAAGKIQLGDNAALGAGPLTLAVTTTLDMHGFSGTAGTLSGSGTITSAASGSISLTVGDSNSSTFTGLIQNGSGVLSLVKQGTGSISLFSANSYTGTTTISAGTLVVSTSTSLGATTGGVVTISAGGTLDLTGDATANNLNFGTKQFAIAGAGADGVSGAIINNSTVTQTAAFQNILLTANATIGGSQRYDLRNGVSTLDLATHTLTKTGSGQISLVGATLKNGGAIVVNQGILSLETSTNTSGAGSITYGPNTAAQFFANTGSILWTLNFQGNNVIGNSSGTPANIAAPVVLSGNVTFVPLNAGAPLPTATNPLILTGNISQSGGSFGFTKLGVNILTLSGNNTFTGPVNIQQGTVQLNSATALPAAAIVTLGSGTNTGILDLNANTVTIAGLSTGGTGIPNTISNSSTTGNATLIFAGGTSTFGGMIQNTINGGTKTVALTVNSGTLALTSNLSSYSGPTTLNGGTLNFTFGNDLSTTSLIFNGGTLQYAAGNSADISSRTVTINAGGATIDTNSNNVTYLLPIGNNGSGTLTKVGGGTLTLSGSNTFSGGVILTGGTLSVSSDNNLGTAGGNITFNGGTFQVTGTAYTSTARTINWSTPGGTFNIASSANTFTINSPLTGGGLSQLGAGTLVLNQNLNVTTGDPTTVTLGSLQFNGSSNSVSAITGGGNVTINPGASLTSDAIQLNNLSIGGISVIRQNLTTPAVSTVSSLTLAGTAGPGGASDTTSVWTGALDLTNSKLIVEDATVNRAADLATLQNQALSANTQNNTVGIYSSTAAAANTAAGKTVMVVAVVDNAVRLATFPSGSTLFGGQSVDASSILITSAFKGDANLDGVVDIQDLTAVANHWQQSVTDWSQGDFDGSNFVDIQDLTAVANNWQAGLSSGGGSSFSDALAEIGGLTHSTATPEPTSVAVLGLGGALLATRRRNKR